VATVGSAGVPASAKPETRTKEATVLELLDNLLAA